MSQVKQNYGFAGFVTCAAGQHIDAAALESGDQVADHLQHRTDDRYAIRVGVGAPVRKSEQFRIRFVWKVLMNETKAFAKAL